MRWVIATRNPDKFREIKSIISPFIKEVLFLREIAPDLRTDETSLTLHENALKKAQEAFRETKMPSIAEDTGLFVMGIDGAPGVFSSRFAGEGASYEENRKKLLDLLKGADFSTRRAYFKTVAVAIVNEKTRITSEGLVEGVIVKSERGGKGFGYDPLFLYPPLGKTFAEIEEEVKNKISHRYKALTRLMAVLKDRGLI